jgi:DNA-directed RNA polymerase subunit omega
MATIDELMQKSGDSKYTLVVMAAKRAREIVDEQHDEENVRLKPVLVALKEIASGKISFERVKSGLK